jgi:zinc/manganese transport system substrate-binding protein
MRLLCSILAVLCVAKAVAGAAETKPLRVVTLSTVLTEIATAIGGDDVVVQGLVLPTVDPHTFDPTPRDIRAAVEADVVLASGLGLESYLDRLVARGDRTMNLVIAADALRDPAKLPLEFADHPDEADPHWWQSPGAVREVSLLIATAFRTARPEQASAFDTRSRAWLEKLDQLEAWARGRAAQIPAEQRHLITSHDAFGWLARDLGLKVHPIKGLSSESEPSGRHVAELVDLIKRQHIRAVFAENIENSRMIDSLTTETGARLGGTLFADGLGPPGSGAETYEAMYRHNVTTIVDALGEN